MLTCNMCGGTDATISVEGPGTWHCYEPTLGKTFPFKVAVCRRCGHVFGAWQDDRTHLYADQEYITCATDLEQYTSYVNFVLAGLPAGNRRPRVLEIGFNQGALLQRFHDLGFDCYGIEAGPHNVEAARTRMKGAHLEAGMYDEEWMQRFEPGFFDVIMLTSVLEHISNPADTLRSLRPRLALTGRLFIVVPDLCFYTPTYQIPAKSRDRYGCSQVQFFYRNLFLCYAQHVNHFSGPSLVRYLAALGLQTAQLATIGYIWVAAAPADPVDPSFEYPDLVEFHMDLMSYYEQLLEEMRRAMLARLAGRRVVCYGAGREFGYFLDVFAPLGLEVLAVADDSTGPDQVHGTPRVPPGALAGYRPDVCLATSFNFESEIATKVRTLLPRSTDVLTLTELIAECHITAPPFVRFSLTPAIDPVPTACTR